MTSIQNLFSAQQADAAFAAIDSTLRIGQDNGTDVPFHQFAEGFRKTAAPHSPLGDVKRALRRFYTACSESNSSAERGILYQGLVGSLRKDILETGWNIILWEKLLELQPADVEFLVRLMSSPGIYLEVHDSESDFELSERLARKGLCWSVHDAMTGKASVTGRGAIKKMHSLLFP